MAYKRIFVRSHPTAAPTTVYIGENDTVEDAIKAAQYSPDKHEASLDGEPVEMGFNLANESEIILTPKKYSSGVDVSLG